jgi:hypothetical protein
MNNPNAQSYKALIAKSVNKRRASYDFDRILSNVTQELLPSLSPNRSAAADNNRAELEKATETYDKRLNQLEKEQSRRMGELGKNSEREFSRLNKQVQNGDEKNLELSESLRAAIERLAQSKQGGGAEQAEEQPLEEETPGQSAASEVSLEDMFADPDAMINPNAMPAPVPTATTTTVSKAAKKVINIGDSIPVGDFVYKVTNLFGPRSGSNAVPGRADGEHSNGMDMVGFSADGKQSNLPISLTDGEIVGINLQGSGDPIRPEQGKAGGYIMSVKTPDANAPGKFKIIRYMHLDKSVWEQKAKLMNTPVKRGQLLIQGSGSAGSGSQTGPHVKVSISNLDEKGNDLRDYSNPQNDPKTYALYGNYVEEQ